MTTRGRVLATGATVLWLVVATANLASGEDELFWIAGIALTPMVIVAFSAVHEVLGTRDRQATLRTFTSSFAAVCTATNFFLLAIVVGGRCGAGSEHFWVWEPERCSQSSRQCSSPGEPSTSARHRLRVRGRSP